MTRRFLTYLVAVAILFVVPLSVSSKLRDTTGRLVSPLTRGLSSQSSGIRNAIANLRSIGQVREENARLGSQVLSLQQQLINQDAISQQNALLRSQAGVTGVTQSIPKVLGTVTLHDPDPIDRTYTIDVGATSGIKVGHPVTVQGQLVGRIISVRDHSSVVRSLTSQKSQIQAWISFDREIGLLTGTGTGVELKEITQGIDIPAGSVVETSGIGGTLPQGILLGSTDSLVSAKSETTQEFSIRQEIDPNAVQSVFVLLTDL
jgi:rod shape-determining protein MreC